MSKLLAIAIVCWGIFFYQTAKAGDYETATGAHIITETIKGTDIDHQSLLNAETQKLIHQMSLDMINIVFQTMPNYNKTNYVPNLTGGTKPLKNWKLEESKKFTIAPAYNKGAYQVINKKDIKDIGK